MADLMHEGNTRITGFGMCCGDHTPETAPFFAREEGIHQVMGLFRSRPYLEPRLAALALRTATDCFAGDGGDARGGLLAPRVVRAGLYRAPPRQRVGGT